MAEQPIEPRADQHHHIGLRQRDVARRGPYMHDGSYATLGDVIDLYDRGGIDRPSRDDLIHQLNLPQGDKADLVAFLQTLSGKPEFFAVPVLPR